MSFGVWAAIGGLGGVGAVTRFLVDAMIGQRLGRDFPWGTLVINVSGAFVLGLLTGLTAKGDTLLLAGTALIGSYTTFSTWMFETHRLAEDGDMPAAAINLALSIAAGVGAAALGRIIGGQL